jgi:hypothetical protein
MSKSECDFCSDDGVPVVTSYGAKNFRVELYLASKKEHITLDSTNDWFACAKCRKLVDAKDMEKLLDRAEETYKKRHDEDTPHDLKEMLGQLHKAFFANRTKRN